MKQDNVFPPIFFVPFFPLFVGVFSPTKKTQKMTLSVLHTRTPAASASGAMSLRSQNLSQRPAAAKRLLSGSGAGQIVVGANSMRSSSRRSSHLSASIVARASARAELKALIFDCDGEFFVRKRNKRCESELLLVFLRIADLYYRADKRRRTLTFFSCLQPTSRRHPRVRGTPPPRLQRRVRALRHPLSRT